MKNQPYTNLELLYIIVAAWNYNMADANAVCAKSEIKPDQRLADLASFITGDKVSLDELFLSKSQYAEDCIDHYNTFKELSQKVKYSKWKSLKKNPIIKTYGIMFDMYLSKNFDYSFLKYTPFFRLTPRQFAKVFIKLKEIILK